MNMYTLLKNVLPTDHSRQVSSWYFADSILRTENIGNVLDLGCGNGGSLEYFKREKPDIKWMGVDIEFPQEGNLRNKTYGGVTIYDGINLPFADGSFDMVFSNQVFEHVRYPGQLLAELKRVLKPEGYFIGSVSHLEPYHSLSLWNYTPYGFKILIEESNLELKEIRPGIDALTLIIRRLLRDIRFFDRYWKKDSPLNALLGLIGCIFRKRHDEINLIKLLFCGQFVFLAQKQEPSV